MITVNGKSIEAYAVVKRNGGWVVSNSYFSNNENDVAFIAPIQKVEFNPTKLIGSNHTQLVQEASQSAYQEAFNYLLSGHRNN